MNKTSSFARLKKLIPDAHQPMFHSTNVQNALKILQEGFKAKSGGGDAHGDNAVCFTRDFDFTNNSIFGQVTFVVDRVELKQRYKIYSYDWVYKMAIRNSLFFSEEPEVFELMSLVLEKWIHNQKPQVIESTITKKAGDYLEDQNEEVYEDDDLETILVDFINNFYSFKTCNSYSDIAKVMHRILSDTAKHTSNALHINGDEFEERVSNSAMGKDGKPTIIPPKYIKYVLVTKKLQYEKLKDLPFTFIFADYKKGNYKIVSSSEDIEEIPLNDALLQKHPELEDKSIDQVFYFLMYQGLEQDIEDLFDSGVKVSALNLTGLINASLRNGQYPCAVLFMKQYGSLRSKKELEFFLQSNWKNDGGYIQGSTLDFLAELIEAAVFAKAYGIVDIITQIIPEVYALSGYNSNNYDLTDLSESQISDIVSAALQSKDLKFVKRILNTFNVDDIDFKDAVETVLDSISMPILKYIYENFEYVFEDFEDSYTLYYNNVDNIAYIAEKVNNYAMLAYVAIKNDNLEFLKVCLDKSTENVVKVALDIGLPSYQRDNKVFQYLESQGLLTRVNDKLVDAKAQENSSRKAYRSILKGDTDTLVDLVSEKNYVISSENIKDIIEENNPDMLEAVIRYTPIAVKLDIVHYVMAEGKTDWLNILVTPDFRFVSEMALKRAIPPSSLNKEILSILKNKFPISGFAYLEEYANV